MSDELVLERERIRKRLGGYRVWRGNDVVAVAGVFPGSNGVIEVQLAWHEPDGAPIIDLVYAERDILSTVARLIAEHLEPRQTDQEE